MKNYQKKNRSYFIGALLCVLISTVFAVALQFFKGDVLDAAVEGNTQSAIRYAAGLILFILLEVLFYYFYKRLSARFVVGCTKCLKHDIFNSIINRGYVAYKEQTQGEYIAKYTNEAESIKARRFGILPLFWEILFRIIFVSTALFLLDWRIALVTIALLTTPLYVPKLIEKSLQKAQTDYLKAVEDNISKLNDWLSGFEIIKNFSIERKIMEKFEESNENSMEKLLRDMQLGAVAQLITTLISYLSYFIVLVCATWLVIKGDFSAGDFFVAIGMIDQLSYPLISLADIIRLLIAIKPACASMEEFIASSAGGDMEKQLKGFDREICFRDACFSYDRQTPVLQNFALTVRKGGRYLLKGPSGCGKTTAVNLLLRYFQLNSGSLEIDGKPINEVGSTYGCMTVVRQEAVLFHNTLRNNLTMYRDIPDVKLIEMLKSLGLDKFARTEALDALVEESGANFSGGEKKRICLARALLRDTEILILDEPLANLDEDTAKKIEDLLLSISGKTMLVVSHQFSEEKVGAFSQVLDFAAKA